MTVAEVRAHKEYAICMEKIKGYKKGFRFTINYAAIPTAKCNALKIVLRDAVEQGLIKSVALGYSLECINTDETFEKL